MNWKNVKDYEGIYEISDTGIIRGVDRYIELPNGKKRFAKGRILQQSISNKGYAEIRLNKGGKARSYLIHRLTAQAFKPNPDGLPQVNHLSGDKLDNSVENLEWKNASGNTLHAYKTGLNSNCGCNHNLAVPVIDLKTGDIYCTVKAFCETYGINYNSGKNALNGLQDFPKSVDLSGHLFEKYFC